MPNRIELIGIYEVSGHEDVYLIELGISTNHKNLDIGQFTQTQDGIDQLNWQAPWDEKYLNADGTIITGDWMDSPNDSSDYTRLAFFLHFIDFQKPLLTQWGELELKSTERMPDRISSIIEYEKP